MFCSTVIPTIGRATLSRAVCSVLDQSFAADESEVIVVNDSGSPLPKADWQDSGRVRLIHTTRRERCVARNVGAAISKGSYLHFLDDDDWLLPGALNAFWELSHDSDAAWLYGASQLVDRQDQPLIQLHHNLSGNILVQVMAGEWIPLQSSLINAKAFFSVGGFNPHIPGTEDIDLVRRIALRGELAETPEVVAAIGMGTEGSTTDYARSAQSRRWAREAVLDESTTFARMRASANTSAWRGRLVRAYLTSVQWNLVHGRFFAALSRIAFAIAGFVFAGRRLFSSAFWRNLAHDYESDTFIRGFREANLPVQRRPV